MKNVHTPITILLLSFLIACNPATPAPPTPDINAIHTAAAQTVIAEFTQTARAISPTESPTATTASTEVLDTAQPDATGVTETPTADIILEATPTDITCDDAKYVADITVPDGTEMTPGQDFVKTWKIQNIGSCTWGTGYTIIHGYDIKMEGIAEPLNTAVAPGEEVEISVRFKAPTQAGEYRSYWRMANASDNPFGEFFYVTIVVR